MLSVHNRATIESNLRKIGGLSQSQVKQVFRGSDFAANPKRATLTHQGLEKFLSEATEKGHISQDKAKELYHSIRKQTETEWEEHPELHVSKTILRQRERLEKLEKRGLVSKQDNEEYKSRTQELAESRKKENIRERIMERAREERKEVNEEERKAEEGKESKKSADKKPDFQMFAPPPVMPI